METIEKSKLKELYEIKKIEKKGKKVTGIGYDFEGTPVFFWSEDGKMVEVTEKQDDESVELFRSSWTVDRYFWERISLKERKERSLDRYNTIR
jgi:ribulose kinase